MQQTRREILDEFLRHADEYNDSEARNLAELLLNRAYLNVWLTHPFNDHRLPSPIQITTIANTRDYVLPQYFGRLPLRVEYLRNLTTEGRLEIWSADKLEERHPEAGTDLESAGTPRIAVIGGVVGVRVQPSSSGQALEVLSSDSGDTDIRVSIEGVDSDGQWNETQVTLSGTNPVAIGTWKPPIVNFAKAYPAGTTPATELTSSRGTVTLRVASGGATLGTLLPEESAREFPSLTLYPKPTTAGEIIAVPAIRAPKKLYLDSDEVPRFWGSAILEEMWRLWKIGTGEPPAADPGPEVKRLVAHDNSTISGRIRTRPAILS